MPRLLDSARLHATTVRHLAEVYGISHGYRVIDLTLIDGPDIGVPSTWPKRLRQCRPDSVRYAFHHLAGGEWGRMYPEPGGEVLVVNRSGAPRPGRRRQNRSGGTPMSSARPFRSSVA